MKKKKSEGTTRLNNLLKSVQLEHASADYLLNLLKGDRYSDLYQYMKEQPQILGQFQEFLSEFAVYVRDTEHHIVSHEMGTYLRGMFRAAKLIEEDGSLSPRLRELSNLDLTALLLSEFVFAVDVTQSMFYERDLVDVYMLAHKSSDNFSTKELAAQEQEMEDAANQNVRPILKKLALEHDVWAQSLEKQAKKAKKEKVLFNDPIEGLVFGRQVGKA